MAFVLLDENNVVIQKQPYPEDGFIEVADDVFCGQIRQQSGAFINPTPPSPPNLPTDEPPESITMRDVETGNPVMFEVRDGAFNKIQES